jgi:hypothetical protein
MTRRDLLSIEVSLVRVLLYRGPGGGADAALAGPTQCMGSPIIAGTGAMGRVAVGYPRGPDGARRYPGRFRLSLTLQFVAANRRCSSGACAGAYSAEIM